MTWNPMYVSLLSPCILLIFTTNVEMTNQLHSLSLKLQWLWNVCNNWVTLATEGLKAVGFHIWAWSYWRWQIPGFLWGWGSILGNGQCLMFHRRNNMLVYGD
jgi:hypothetical protein